MFQLTILGSVLVIFCSCDKNTMAQRDFWREEFILVYGSRRDRPLWRGRHSNKRLEQEARSSHLQPQMKQSRGSWQVGVGYTFPKPAPSDTLTLAMPCLLKDP